MAKQWGNLHKISLRMNYPGEWKNLEDLQLRKVGFPTDRPDAQLPRSERPSQKLSVQSRSGRHKHHPDATYGNPSLFRIRISESYLKGLCACNFVRIQYWIPVC
jgi:hypothetical protein